MQYDFNSKLNETQTKLRQNMIMHANQLKIKTISSYSTTVSLDTAAPQPEKNGCEKSLVAIWRAPCWSKDKDWVILAAKR